MMRRQFIFKHILFSNLEEASVLNKHLHSSKLYQLICTEQILLPNGESITCLHEWRVEKGTDSSLPHTGARLLTAGLFSRSFSFGPCFLIDQHLLLVVSLNAVVHIILQSSCKQRAFQLSCGFATTGFLVTVISRQNTFSVFCMR